MQHNTLALTLAFAIQYNYNTMPIQCNTITFTIQHQTIAIINQLQYNTIQYNYHHNHITLQVQTQYNTIPYNYNKKKKKIKYI